MNFRLSLVPLAILWAGAVVLGADSGSGSIHGVISSFDGKAKVKLLTVKVQAPVNEEKPDKTKKPGQDAGDDPGQSSDQKPVKKDKPKPPGEQGPKPDKPGQDAGDTSAEVVFIVDDKTEIVIKGKSEEPAGVEVLKPGKEVDVAYGEASLLLDSGKPSARGSEQDNGEQKPEQKTDEPKKPTGDQTPSKPPKKGKLGAKPTFRAGKITVYGKPGKPNQDKPTQDKPKKPDQKKPDQKKPDQKN